MQKSYKYSKMAISSDFYMVDCKINFMTNILIKIKQHLM